MYMRLRSLVSFLFLFISCITYAQDKYNNPYRTDNTRVKPKYEERKNEPKRKKIRVIIKNNPRGILYGNPCLEEETRNMGFQYTVQNAGLPGSLKPVTLRIHNFKVHAYLVLTKSPFWKGILNRRIKDCREKTGDWIG